MKGISFVKPDYPGERRIALLPDDLRNIGAIPYGEIFIETGFGSELGIGDEEYSSLGCKIVDRSEAFRCEYIFSLKLISEADYSYLKAGAKIIGWMHPLGSGTVFYKFALANNIAFFDIDSVMPRVYFPSGEIVNITELPKHFLWENSYLAGIASVENAIKLAFGADDILGYRTCVLGCGSVSQGAFNELSVKGLRPRIFYRKTLDIFYGSVGEYDIIVNGVEMDTDGYHLIGKEQLLQTKNNVLLIDAAADAGRAIEGTEYRSLEKPFGLTFGRRYFMVNNAPTLRFQEASTVISKVVSTLIITKKYF